MSIDDTKADTMSNTMDNTIREVERLYQSITGSDVPPEGETAFAAIPPEVDPRVEGQVLRWREAAEGSFERVMPLPRGAFDDELRVSLKDGCLEIRVPTKAATAPVTLEIQ